MSKKKKEVKQEERGAGFLKSSLNHSVVVSYNGMGMVVPPRGRVKVADKQLVGSLPNGVVKL